MPVGLAVVLCKSRVLAMALFPANESFSNLGSDLSCPKFLATMAEASSGSMSPKTVTIILSGTKYLA